MSFDLPPLAPGASAPVAAPAPTIAAAVLLAVRSSARPAVPVIVDAVPAAPPPAVLAEVDAAARRLAELEASGRRLSFRSDPVSRRIVVEVRDAAGRVLRTIPPSAALALAAGGRLEL